MDIKQTLFNCYKFSFFVIKKFKDDKCSVYAANLSINSILATVPLLAISFAIFAAFPAFEKLEDKLYDFIFNNLLPATGENLRTYLEGFTQATGSLTAVGILFLAITSIMLLSNISSNFNMIWQTPKKRSLIDSLLVFWAILTLSPLLFGVSLSISSYVFAITNFIDIDNISDIARIFAKFSFILTILLQSIGFCLLFLIMPACKVSIKDALIGGLITGIMFDILKKLFGIYINAFPTYETIYGALATIPILIIWILLVWNIILLGAEITASLPKWGEITRNNQN